LEDDGHEDFVGPECDEEAGEDDGGDEEGREGGEEWAAMARGDRWRAVVFIVIDGKGRWSLYIGDVDVAWEWQCWCCTQKRATL
jgi:hypothetical protein